MQEPSSLVRWLLPASLALVYFLTLVYLQSFHPFGTYATETDFYHLFAPDAQRIGEGRFPENPYQGPGYPALLAVVARWTGDLFIAGKWVSIVSATAVLLLTFALFSRLTGYWSGLGAALIVSASGEFPQFAINATTDVFFLMLCLATLVLFTCRWRSERLGVALAGAAASLAYLTRYNGIFLLVACLFGILGLGLVGRDARVKLKLAAIFVGVFLLVALPWLYANTRHRGSPFYNANYLNIAAEFYPELVGGRTNQDATRVLDASFHSFGDVLGHDPKRFLTHYPANLLESLVKSVATTLVHPLVGGLALVGAVLALGGRRSKPMLFVLASGALYFLLMGLNHWETRYYFVLMVLYAGLAAHAAFGALERARARGLLRQRAWWLLPAAAVVAFWGLSFAGARREVARFLASHPREILGARDYLLRTEVRGARILSRKPHLAFMSGGEWVFFPAVKSVEELRGWLQANPVDYIAVGRIEVVRRPELAVLGDPRTAPSWLEVVWVNEEPRYVLYRTLLN